MAKSNLSKLYGFDGYDQIGEVTSFGRLMAFVKRETLLNSEYQPVKGFDLLSTTQVVAISLVGLPVLVVALSAAYIWF